MTEGRLHSNAQHAGEIVRFERSDEPAPAVGSGPAAPRSAATVAPLPNDRARRSALGVLVGASRPRQWPKNVLVFAAPGTAGLLSHPVALGRTAAAAVIFLVASAGTYLVNDVLDAAEDRLHPKKRRRPVASGALSPTLALVLGAELDLLAVGAALALAGVVLGLVIGGYVLLTLSYSLVLKRVAVVELACVASGFVLRAVAGGAAVHIPISPWFLMVASSGALLIVAGKRSAELVTLGEFGAAHRQVLRRYPETFLRSVRQIAATAAIMSYGLWAFERAARLATGLHGTGSTLIRLSILPFVIAILVIELAIESGEGGAPEELALTNHGLQVAGVACVLLVAIGVYA